MIEMADYGSITPTFPDRDDWILSRILAEQSLRHANKIFLSEPPDRTYTYSEIDDLASRIGSGLLERGLVEGDRLLILLPNCSEYILAWFGAARAGIVEVPTNVDYFGDFLEHAVRLTAPKAIVVSSELVQRFVDIRASVQEVGARFFVVGSSSIEKAVRILTDQGFVAEQFSTLLAATPLEGLGRGRRRTDLASILFTSGTTGRSKGVMMSEAHLYFFADQCVSLVRLTEEDVYMTANPLFHGNAQFLTVYPALISGAQVVLYDRFSPTRWVQRVRESRATVTNLVGAMMSWIFNQPETSEDLEHRLRCIFSAPTASSILDSFKQRFGVETFVECFGQTEISMPILTPYGVDRPPGAAGLAVTDWFEIRLADPDTDDEVPPGEVGELLVRPKEPWIVNSGYWGMPDATADARRNLWLHTGDGLRRDEDGWYYFVDRLKDCLRRRGENISSQEVEGPILAHPAVAECAVIGVPADEEAGEDEVRAFVVVHAGAQLRPEEIVEWAIERMPSFLVPRYVELIDSLPVTPNGKVQKAKLRGMPYVNSTYDRLTAAKPRTE